MGQILSAGLSALDDIAVTTLVDPHEPAATGGATWVPTLSGAGEIDVVVDFSSARGVVDSAAWCARHHVNLVVGATGLSPNDIGTLATNATDAGIGIIVASNFSIGAVLSERFAAAAAAYFDRVEIVELHHDQKADAPSGTSIATARAIAASRERAGLAPIVDPTLTTTLPGSRGADGGDGVVIHSVRLPGLVAHQEILFGRPGEGLTIRHDSYDRKSYVAGVALAVRAVGTAMGLRLGIDDLVT